MKRLAISGFALIVAATVAGFAILAAGGSPILRAIDGDTIAMGPGGTVVRLVGFNAPETGRRAKCERERALGAVAKERLASLIAAGKTELRIIPCSCKPGTEGTEACNYGRACGILTVNNRDVADILIGEGLAVPYHCGTTSCPRLPRPWCDP